MSTLPEPSDTTRKYGVHFEDGSTCILPEAALARQEELAASAVAPGSCSYPVNCAGKVLPRPDTQSWQMNKSTIIMCATPKGSSAITRAEA